MRAMSEQQRQRRRNQRGSILVFTVVSFTALVGMAALAIDMSRLMNTRSQMQHMADATVLAATSGLIIDVAEGQDRAVQYANANPVLGVTVPVNPGNLTFGQFDEGTGIFTPTLTFPNAGRIVVNLTGSSTPTTPKLFFAPMFGLRSHDLSVAATARLGSRDIMLILDRSGSMNDDGSSPEQPLTDTKTAAKQFVTNIETNPLAEDQVGLVWYSTSATLVHELTTNYTAVRTAIDSASASGWTNVPHALLLAREELTSNRSNSRAARVAVLLSDGVTNTAIGGSGGGQGALSEQQSRDQADAMAGEGITLYTISLGTNTNQTFMADIAARGNGVHFFSPTVDQLDNVFQEISNRIPVVLVE
jgi:Mg-chelatase subunit ChlD